MDRVDEPVFIVKRLAGKLVVYLSSFFLCRLLEEDIYASGTLIAKLLFLKDWAGRTIFHNGIGRYCEKQGWISGKLEAREVKLERKRARKRSEGFRTKGQNVKREMKERVSKITRVKEWQYFAFSSPFPLLYATFSVSSSNN